MVKDVILADSDGREMGAILDSNITVDMVLCQDLVQVKMRFSSS